MSKQWIITVKKRSGERVQLDTPYRKQGEALAVAELLNDAHPEMDAKVEEYKEEKK